MSGNALITDGRLRSFAFPHALEAINGIVTFDAAAVRLDGLRARLGRRHACSSAAGSGCAGWR